MIASAKDIRRLQFESPLRLCSEWRPACHSLLSWEIRLLQVTYVRLQGYFLLHPWHQWYSSSSLQLWTCKCCFSSHISLSRLPTEWHSPYWSCRIPSNSFPRSEPMLYWCRSCGLRSFNSAIDRWSWTENSTGGWLMSISLILRSCLIAHSVPSSYAMALCNWLSSTDLGWWSSPLFRNHGPTIPRKLALSDLGLLSRWSHLWSYLRFHSSTIAAVFSCSGFHIWLWKLFWH